MEFRNGFARQVEREWLDDLPATDPRAIHSRSDLQRLNFLMGHAGILSRILRRYKSGLGSLRVVELAAGDGTLLLRVAKQMKPHWGGVEAILVDQQALLRPETTVAFEALNWRITTVQSDVFEWLRNQGATAGTVGIANLFLHHFENCSLKSLLEGVSKQCDLFVACEPRRSAFALFAARLIGAIGCGPVTRHDAIASVRSGFRDEELSQLWPRETSLWHLEERSAGLFSHCFCARRVEPADHRRS